MAHIQQLFGSEIQQMSHSLRSYSFYPSPPLFSLEQDTVQRQKYYERYRGFAYISQGQAVTFAIDIPMKQLLRGSYLPMSGIAAVASHPEYRRKGYVRQTLRRLLEVGKEQGSVVSTLYPFRESFYERMGYVSFPHLQSLEFPVIGLASLTKVTLTGKVKRYPMMERFEAYRAFLAEHAKSLHGFAWNEVGGWDLRVAEQEEYWLAMAESEGKVVGVMLYKLDGYEGNFIAERFYYSNSLGKYLLLQWIGLHEGQVEKVRINLPPYALQDGMWADLSIKLTAYLPPMGRIVQVEALARMQVGTGSFCARIVDELCPWQQGIWKFEGREGRLRISKSEGADCTLEIQALSALVYGTHDPGDFAFRGWGNPPFAVQQEMRSIFSRQVPYIHETF